MSGGYQESNFRGDETHTINATGDVVVGDEVAFDRATFSGSWRSPTFTGFERVIGRVIRDSYGRDRQQHTFTLELEDGSTTRIKGRNLYGNGVWRRRWADEDARQLACDEKHARGAQAREVRRGLIDERDALHAFRRRALR